MHPSVDTEWFSRRNLTAVRVLPVANEPREVVIYLLVTLAVRPDVLPKEVVAHLAARYFGHCTEVGLTH
jgi:hypothetical protein